MFLSSNKPHDKLCPFGILHNKKLMIDEKKGKEKKKR